jgi:hypothetical protein
MTAIGAWDSRSTAQLLILSVEPGEKKPSGLCQVDAIVEMDRGWWHEERGWNFVEDALWGLV